MNPTPEYVPMIIPTVMIPLTMLSVGISVVAAFIAGLFGIKLKTEGPKKLLEVLLKPRVLISSLLLNLVIWGGVQGWKWWKNYPKLLFTIHHQMKSRATPSDKVYKDNAAEAYAFKTPRTFDATLPTGVEQNWKFESGTGIFSSPALSSGSLFVGNRAGIVSEIEVSSGKVLRSFYVGSPATSRLTVWKNSLYVGEGVHDLHDARIYRFNLKSGQLEGTYSTKGHIEAQSIIATSQGEDTLFVVAGSDGLHAVDPLSLKVKWKANHGHLDSAVAVDEDRVYLGTGREKDDDKKNKTYAVSLDFKSGKEVWKHELPASSWMTPVIVGKNVCYIAGEIYFPSERGHFLCFDKKNGEHSLSFNFNEPLASQPLVLDNDVIVSTINGQICRLDMNKKEKRWCFVTQSTGTGFSGPAFDSARNLLVYPSNDKGLFALNPETGALVLQWNPSEEEGAWKKTYAGLSIDQGLWIVSDYVSTVRALRPTYAPPIKKQAMNDSQDKSKEVRNN